jgi:hypothetical protein
MMYPVVPEVCLMQVENEKVVDRLGMDGAVYTFDPVKVISEDATVVAVGAAPQVSCEISDEDNARLNMSTFEISPTNGNTPDGYLAPINVAPVEQV